MGFLDSPQQEVVIISLQALEFLSTHPNNKEPLCKEPGLLVKLIGMQDHQNELIARMSKSVIENLQSCINGEGDENASGRTANVAAPAAKPAQPAAKSSAAPTAPTPSKPTLYSVPLKIARINTVLQRARLEKALLAVKSVVSVTVELNQTQATVYTRSKDVEVIESLVEAAQGVGMAAEAGQCEVETDEVKEPIKAPAPAAAAAAAAQTTAAAMPAPAYHAAPAFQSGSGAPRYMSTADPSKAPRYGSIVEYGARHMTAEERAARARKREEEKQAKQGAVRSLFTSVTSYFW
jgi:hypothetical protein